MTQDARRANIGDTIFVDWSEQVVTDIRYHMPYSHPQSPIKNELTAVEVVTAAGSRWFGEEYYASAY